jgi:hypothetical protein
MPRRVREEFPAGAQRSAGMLVTGCLLTGEDAVTSYHDLFAHLARAFGLADRTDCLSAERVVLPR